MVYTCSLDLAVLTYVHTRTAKCAHVKSEFVLHKNVVREYAGTGPWKLLDTKTNACSESSTSDYMQYATLPPTALMQFMYFWTMLPQCVVLAHVPYRALPILQKYLVVVDLIFVSCLT